jgi:hypothetical protein
MAHFVSSSRSFRRAAKSISSGGVEPLRNENIFAVAAARAPLAWKLSSGINAVRAVTATELCNNANDRRSFVGHVRRPNNLSI